MSRVWRTCSPWYGLLVRKEQLPEPKRLEEESDIAQIFWVRKRDFGLEGVITNIWRENQINDFSLITEEDISREGLLQYFVKNHPYMFPELLSGLDDFL